MSNSPPTEHESSVPSERLPGQIRARSGLADLTREDTLAEIAVITRAGPATMLALTSQGHLGADGDVAIFAPDDDKRRMFTLPRPLIKAGEVVLDHDLRAAPDGTTQTVAPEFDPGIVPEIAAWFERDSSIRFVNFQVNDQDLGD
jgi:formylmethanofuran dehydrogenase subunit A